MLSLNEFNKVEIKNPKFTVGGRVTIVGSSGSGDLTTKDLQFEDGQVICDVADSQVDLFMD